eukprot:m.65767 g.65767  ORF g.65767 m.65767 type:complete len:627 (-) comp8164_c0_seq2:49-1929(-)
MSWNRYLPKKVADDETGKVALSENGLGETREASAFCEKDGCFAKSNKSRHNISRKEEASQQQQQQKQKQKYSTTVSVNRYLPKRVAEARGRGQQLTNTAPSSKNQRSINNTSSTSATSRRHEDQNAVHMRRQYGDSMLDETHRDRAAYLERKLEMDSKALCATTTASKKADSILRGECETMCFELECLNRMKLGVKNSAGSVWIFEMTRRIPHPESITGDGFFPRPHQEMYKEFVFDEQRAVKEYRRAAADGRSQLSCEIRSPKALLRAMVFLASDIMHVPIRTFTSPVNQERVHPSAILEGKVPGVQLQCNYHVQLWHDYLVDRMRAIRKDIASQHIELLDVHDAFSVIVMILRFHILAQYVIGGCVDGLWLDNTTNNKFLADTFALGYMLLDLKNQNSKINNDASSTAANEDKMLILETEFLEYKILFDAIAGNLKEHSLSNLSPHLFTLVMCLSNLNFQNLKKAITLIRHKLSIIQICGVAPFLNSYRHHAFGMLRKSIGKWGIPLSKLQMQLGFDDKESCMSWLSSMYNVDDGGETSQSSSFALSIKSVGDSMDMLYFTKGVPLAIRKEKRMSFNLAFPQKWINEKLMSDAPNNITSKDKQGGGEDVYIGDLVRFGCKALNQ